MKGFTEFKRVAKITLMPPYKEVAELLKQARYAIAFTGAGISVESGIPPFRGKEGLWTKYNPEEYAYLEAFMKNPAKVWRMLREMFEVIFRAKPNEAHYALAKLEEAGYLKGIITQNIDGLHQLAGSKRVIEFHGNCRWLRCVNCGERVEVTMERINILPYPTCKLCKGPLKPEVIFFGEPIPHETIEEAEAEAKRCDLMLIIGTSGVVYPACNLPYLAKRGGAKIVEINPEETTYTWEITDYFFKERASKALVEILKHLE